MPTSQETIPRPDSHGLPGGPMPEWKFFQSKVDLSTGKEIGFSSPDGNWFPLAEGEELVHVRNDQHGRDTFIRSGDIMTPFDQWGPKLERNAKTIADEHHEGHPPKPVAEQVFDGVWQTIKHEKSQPAYEPIFHQDGSVTKLKIDPAKKFVTELFTLAHERLADLASEQLGLTLLQEHFIAQADREAPKAYPGDPASVGVRHERSRRLIGSFVDRAVTMLQTGEIDDLTTQLFFRSVDNGGLKDGLSMGYNGLVRKHDEAMPGEAAQDEYSQTIQQLFAHTQDATEKGLFIHVNSQSHIDSGAETVTRYYVSPKLNAQPGEVVKRWTEKLAELGLDKKIYYKVGEGMALRYETLIVYADTDTSSDAEQAILAFAAECPEELMSDTTIPSGIPLAKGIAAAPEPIDLNKLLRYCGKKVVSYNELVSAFCELSLRRAAYGFIDQGAKPENTRPSDIAQAAKPYFVSFMKLAGIDPTTMQHL